MHRPSQGGSIAVRDPANNHDGLQKVLCKRHRSDLNRDRQQNIRAVRRHAGVATTRSDTSDTYTGLLAADLIGLTHITNNSVSDRSSEVSCGPAWAHGPWLALINPVYPPELMLPVLQAGLRMT
jgi:hypothetical protein